MSGEWIFVEFSSVMSFLRLAKDWSFVPSHCACIALFGILLSFMPESPVWLSSKQRYTKARRSSAWLHLPPPTLAAQSLGKSSKMKPIEEDAVPAETKSAFFTRPVLMPLGIGLALLVLQQISGIDAIIFFTVEIFHSSGTHMRKRVENGLFKRKRAQWSRWVPFNYLQVVPWTIIWPQLLSGWFN